MAFDAPPDDGSPVSLEFTARELGFCQAWVGCGDVRADGHRRHDRGAAGSLLRQPGPGRGRGSNRAGHEQPAGKRRAHQPNAVPIAFDESIEDPLAKADEESFAESF